MWINNRIGKRMALRAVYLVATIQVVWCYFLITQPYVNTARYEIGHERMPFQGRMLMMLPMWLAHRSRLLVWIGAGFRNHSAFWFPRPVAPEVVMQAGIDVSCLLLAGWLIVKLYRASSSRQLLTPFIYPLFLVVCCTTYVMHTAQNFRFIYDLPSLAFFAAAMWLIYSRQHWGWFVALFCVATVNRETTLLLLPLYMLNGAVEDGRFAWSRVMRARTLALVLPLATLWVGWEILVRHLFAGQQSEFYPRFDWNLKSLALPLAWPQLLSANGYLLLFVVVMRRRIADPRMRAWLGLIPAWLAFMFVYGILIETRIFGELIPLTVCSTALIIEDLLLARMKNLSPKPVLVVVEPATEVREAA
jgi:hypothetical protein